MFTSKVVLVALVIVVSVVLTQGLELFKVCTSSEFKTMQSEICSHMAKRGQHSNIKFNSYGHHHGNRMKRSASGSHLNVPETCCRIGCERHVYEAMELCG
ncbi:hypothetical protein HDE_03246 [Halotydeus destructor]|nr:hypothetical protein HDE_03246 [Halotydeus destructor]